VRVRKRKSSEPVMGTRREMPRRFDAMKNKCPAIETEMKVQKLLYRGVKRKTTTRVGGP